MTTASHMSVLPSREMPFWSVLIPAYQPSREYFSQALESILSQDPGPAKMQIEVVDDGSPTIDVAALVKAVAGDRITVTRNPENLGLAGCWNLCLGLAQGNWVHLLHQDDLVYREFYTELETTIDQHADAGAAFCRHCFLDEHSSWTGLSAVESHERTRMADWQFRLTGGQRIQCPAVVVRRSVYAALGGFRNDLPYCLDWEMWTRIAASYPFAFSPRILAGYRAHRNSETARLTRAGARLADQIKTFEILVARLPPERRAAARVAFRHYLTRSEVVEDPGQSDIVSALRSDVADQIADGCMPARWYLEKPVAALWAKLCRWAKSPRRDQL
jgi:glycosyltransferase involved in cell wall biosynthesis